MNQNEFRETLRFVARISDLKAVALFTSKDDSRYVLGSILCEVGEGSTIFVATDGRRIAAYRTEALKDGLAPRSTGVVKLPVGWLSRIPKGIKPEWKVEIAVFGKVDNGDPRVAEPIRRIEVLFDKRGSGGLTFCEYEGRFPNWRGVMPKRGEGYVEGCKWDFNVELLADFGKAARILGLSPNVSVRGLRSSEAYVVLIPDPEFVGLLMPLRGEKVDEVPEWAAAPEPESVPQAGT